MSPKCLVFATAAIAVAVCLLQCSALDEPEQPRPPPRWFVCRVMEIIVAQFQRNGTNGTQFAVLLFVPQTARTENDIRNLLQPQYEGINYRYAEPNPQPNENCRTHAEIQTMRGNRNTGGYGDMNALYQQFRNAHGSDTLRYVVLYTWIYPCPACTDAIINDFRNVATFNRPVYVGRTTLGTRLNPPLTDDDRQNILHALQVAGFLLFVIRPPRYLSEPQGVMYSDDSLLLVQSESGESDFCNGLALEGHDELFLDKLRKIPNSNVLFSRVTKQYNGQRREVDGDESSQVERKRDALHRKRYAMHRKGYNARFPISLEMSKSTINDENTSRLNGEKKGGGNSMPSPVANAQYNCIITDQIQQEDKCCDQQQADINKTAEGESCSSNNSCGYHKYAYTWCYKESGGWDYCCSGPCGIRESKSYDWCQAGNTWDYCKVTTFPYPSRTAKGKQCRSNHACGYHGQNYAWCYTDSSNNWDYCCTTTCDSYGEAYDWCTTGTTSKWQYCHRDLPKSFRSSLGKSCNSTSPCGYHSQSYAWCYTTDGSWDYCCTGDCGSHGNKYDWCVAGTKWNYCKFETLPYPDHTYDLTACKTGSTCGYHGYDYAWCYTSSSWNYCCTTECNMQGTSAYDWCTTGTASHWQYCKRSQLPEEYSTAANKPCRSNHSCGYHGYAYAWCYTDNSNNWDYCCSGTCADYGSNYDWCTSGNTWSKCCCSLY